MPINTKLKIFPEELCPSRVPNHNGGFIILLVSNIILLPALQKSETLQELQVQTLSTTV